MADKPIQIVCELANVEVSASDAEVIKSALKKAVDDLYPGRRIQGLWVHKAVPGVGGFRREHE